MRNPRERVIYRRMPCTSRTPGKRRRFDAERRRAMRLDQLLVERGLFASREQARRAVMAGGVEVEGRRVDKPGTAVRGRGARGRRREPFVSRAGRKLAAPSITSRSTRPAASAWTSAPRPAASPTVCCSAAPRRVYAVDVGYGQLDARLRADPRVVVMERVNARHLAPADLPERASPEHDRRLLHLPAQGGAGAACRISQPGGLLLPMIKPQFEAGRRRRGQGRHRARRRCAGGRRGGRRALAALGSSRWASSTRRSPAPEGTARPSRSSARPACA